MTRLLMTFFISAALTFPVLASEKPAQDSANAPKMETPKDAAKGDHPKAKEDKRAERKAAREEKKKENMAEAAKKCSESITEIEGLTKDMAEGENKDMVNHFLAHAKIEATALGNPNMTTHWNQHQRKCNSYARKAKAQAKKHIAQTKVKAPESPASDSKK